MLEALFQSLNQEHFEGALPLPQLRWNARLSSAAGRFTPGSRLKATAPSIEIARYLKDIPDGHTHIRHTLLHEMVHYFLWHQRRPYGHTAEFKRILKRVGAPRYNPVPREREVKHWYVCRHCSGTVGARRRLGTVACAPCCKKYSGGRFDRRFLLVLTDGKLETPKGTVAEIQKPLPPDDLVSRIQAMRDWLKERAKKRALG